MGGQSISSSIMLGLVLGVILGLLSMTAVSAAGTTYPIKWDTFPDLNLGKLFQGKVLQEGDILHFKYNNAEHDLLEVTAEHFADCNNSSPLNKWTDGNSVITLSELGPRFFICGFPDHCEHHDQYLALYVASTKEFNEAESESKSKGVTDTTEAEEVEKFTEVYAKSSSHSVEGLAHSMIGKEGEENSEGDKESEHQAMAPASHSFKGEAEESQPGDNEENELRAPASGPHSIKGEAKESQPGDNEENELRAPASGPHSIKEEAEKAEGLEERETKAPTPSPAAHNSVQAHAHPDKGSKHTVKATTGEAQAPGPSRHGKSNGNSKWASFQFMWCVIPLVWTLATNKMVS
ncbi:unnamed protein product [Calypogeia fissa]